MKLTQRLQKKYEKPLIRSGNLATKFRQVTINQIMYKALQPHRRRNKKSRRNRAIVWLTQNVL